MARFFPEMMIRPVSIEDADRIAAIYNHYVTETAISFEQDPVSPQAMESRIQAIVEQQLPWLVLESGGELVGYAYATTWRKRHAYRSTVESTVYVAANQISHGFGTKLYRALLDELRARNFHTVLGLIAVPNPASVKLHQSFGFKRVSAYAQVGKKFDQWIDMEGWQLMLKDT